MLEEDRLLILPWAIDGRRPQLQQTCHQSTCHILPILQPDKGIRLGVACWQQPTGWLWQRWLAVPRLMIYETEDYSHLFTMSRTWGFRDQFSVQDAEDQRVGLVSLLSARHRNASSLGFVEDALGFILARLESACASQAVHFRASDGSLLGTMRAESEGWLLTFARELQGSPFARMLLLAALLQQVAEPGRGTVRNCPEMLKMKPPG